MFGKVYVLSDAAPCCFSEATLGELSAKSGISITVLLRARFSLLYASGTEKCRWMLTRSSHLWLDSGFLRSFSVDASILFPGLWCRIQWNVQVLRSTVVKVRYWYVVWLSRYSRYSELLPLNVMLLRNTMLYWTGSVKTAVSRESYNVWANKLREKGVWGLGSRAFLKYNNMHANIATITDSPVWIVAWLSSTPYRTSSPQGDHDRGLWL